MSFNLSAWSILKPVPTIVLFLVLTLAGVWAFPTLGINDNPNIDVPSVEVLVTQSGADPAELESQVTKKVEDAVAGLGNIDNIQSTVVDGSSKTIVNFILGTDTDRATNDVRNAISQIRQNLPQDINEPIIQRLEFAGGGPIAIYSIAAEGRSMLDLSNLVDQTISRALLSVPGVAQVNRIGGVDREIRVELNPIELQSVGITATQVNDQIRDFNVNLPGGRAEVNRSEESIRTLGSAKSVSSLADYRIILPQGSVPLSSLGQVTDGAAEARKMARLNNQPIVAFSVLRSTGTTLVTVAEGVQAAVAQLEKTLPEDVKLKLIYTEAEYIRFSYDASVEALILGALLAVVTIWIFLRDWRATVITAIALPLSVIPTFMVLKALDYTLNDLTLLALALVVGILVDDAIVEIENIERHVQMGKTPLQASLDASDEIGLAVVATTMSIVAVFMPVAFMSGISGQFFRPFGITVAASVLFSLLVARTVTPMMAAYLLKPSNSNRAELQHDRLSFQYRRLLIWSLQHRGLTLLMALLFFIGSLMLVPYIPTGLFSEADRARSEIKIELPPGSTLTDTDQATQKLTDLLLHNPAVTLVQSSEEVGTANLFINLKPRSERSLSQKAFEEQIRSQFSQVPGTRISFNKGGPGGGSKELSITLKSENAEALTRTANQLEQEMRQVPGLVEVTSTASLLKPEILIRPNPDRAADQGVSVQSIAQTAILASLGDTDARLAKFDLADRQIPIRVQLAPEFRTNLNVIKNLRVPGKDNSLVPLQTVADISFGNGPSQVDRYNRFRNIAIEANLQGVSLGNALKAVNALPALQNLPPDVVQEDVGNAKIMREIFVNFGTALATAVLFIYAVLVLLFNNFLHPLTIMVALPFSVGGALLGLLVAQKELALFALIGIVLLMGLVSKNSILLVDYALIHRREGKPTYRSVVESGVARLRPILMTTIAMVAGMVPIALGIGAGSETRSPMAIAVIGGLITSTLLTLVVVPVIFTYVDDLRTRLLKQRKSRSASQISASGSSKAAPVDR